MLQDFILFLIAGLLAQVVDSQNPIGWASLVAHPERSIMSAWDCDPEFYYCEANFKAQTSYRHAADWYC